MMYLNLKGKMQLIRVSVYLPLVLLKLSKANDANLVNSESGNFSLQLFQNEGKITTIALILTVKMTN